MNTSYFENILRFNLHKDARNGKKNVTNNLLLRRSLDKYTIWIILVPIKRDKSNLYFICFLD